MDKATILISVVMLEPEALKNSIDNFARNYTFNGLKDFCGNSYPEKADQKTCKSFFNPQDTCKFRSTVIARCSPDKDIRHSTRPSILDPKHRSDCPY